MTLAILGIYRWIADVRMASKRFEAFSLYVQLKDYERTTGNRTIRGIAVHQEYGSTEPIIMGETIDGPKLLREIKRQFIGITLYIAGTLPPVFVFGLVVMTGSNFLLALVAFALSGLALLPLDILGLRMTLAGADAASRLEAIIREEWRTGTPLLPVDFKLPEGHGVFRTPPIPTKAQLGMMRRSRDFRIERVVSAGIAAIAISMISVMLDIGGDLGVIAILAPMLAFMGYFVFRASGLILLDKLREYEEVSGKIVLPPDLSLARMIP